MDTDMTVPVVWHHPGLEGHAAAHETGFRAMLNKPLLPLDIISVQVLFTRGAEKVQVVIIPHLGSATAKHVWPPERLCPPPITPGGGVSGPLPQKGPELGG